MTRIHRGAVALALAAGLAVVSAHGGTPPPQDQPPVFRSGTELVEVYAIVQDGDGKFVSGLTADDFELLEDDQPNSIQLFYLVSGPASRLPRARVADGVPRSADQSAPRIFTLIFDQEHLSFIGFSRLREAAIGFLQEHFRPGDIGGVVINGVMAHGRLTTDRDELIGVLREAKPALDAQSRYEVFREWPRLDSEFEALRIEAGDARVLQEAVTRNCEERPADCNQPGGLEQVENDLQWNARRYLDEERTAANRFIQTLGNVTQGLGRMEGRKTVMLISEGFMVEDSRGILSQIAAKAARFGVTIYSIDAKGLERVGTGASDASQPGRRIQPSPFDTIEDGLFILASNTGGFVVHHTNQFDNGFTRIVDDTSTYYVLGYTPANTVMDGAFRKIEVKVKWKGMHVRARKGYLATPLPPRARRYSK
jgi:VWFA-related protein